MARTQPRPTVDFRGTDRDFASLIRSTATITPRQSHRFHTGTARVLDTAGRVERFQPCYGSKP
ncbi:50S ribosomal protein L31 [Streptomyces xanthophaeus]|uniref:50S ribosomal protein L31 n=1 Tax=Streptomyces xanthophaeus TaxID=67385 RepID=UPI003F59428F|nr:50S ribosomal protein L31 [Streptomyces xanthophaeus]